LHLERPAPPSQPDIVDISTEHATLRWKAPRSDGGAPISNYRIEKRPAGTYRWDLVNTGERVTETQYKVEGIEEGTDYEFRISAENKAGLSEPSLTSRSAKYGQ